MKVSDIMAMNPQSVDINEFITHARDIMRDFNYDSLPVTDNGKVAGMITLQDVINVTSTKSDVTVNGYLRSSVPMLTRDTGLSKAAFIVIHTEEGRVPVVGPGSRLVGLLSVKDIFKGISELGPVDGLVEDRMTKNVVVCQPEDNISRVWSNMIMYGLTGFPVVSMKQEVLGMITRKDITKRGYVRIDRESDGRRTTSTVRKIMSTPAVTVYRGDPMSTAARVFVERDIGRVPVTDNDRLAGIIDRFDVIAACRKLQGVSAK